MAPRAPALFGDRLVFEITVINWLSEFKWKGRLWLKPHGGLPRLGVVVWPAGALQFEAVVLCCWRDGDCFL